MSPGFAILMSVNEGMPHPGGHGVAIRRPHVATRPARKRPEEYHMRKSLMLVAASVVSVLVADAAVAQPRAYSEAWRHQTQQQSHQDRAALGFGYVTTEVALRRIRELFLARAR